MCSEVSGFENASALSVAACPVYSESIAAAAAAHAQQQQS